MTYFLCAAIQFYCPGQHVGTFCQSDRGWGCALTCPWDDDDEAAAAGQLPDDVQMLAESSCVWHQVGRHGRLGLGLLEAAL